MARYIYAPGRSAKAEYRRNRTTFRTVLSPLGLRDPQQAEPAAWCMRCGAEVYRPDTLLCRRCEGQ